ncbi:ADP-ribose diphosphatase [Enteractinococcus fodinae]|uniref:ADP-ribose pyrophosphatase n=1 Tax=Enteractinococcus fodinae TaxID=684663 RepID=A0ABU2B164_9MICC|nr:NUDIX hydrolase [Enteractinococcus fodinae]MDR7347354.1 ADP-ribose pyrophosphatase [Enteractinococcus fodinae]
MTHIQDTPKPVTLQDQQTVFSGAIWEIQRDTFTIEEGDEPLTRDYVKHPGAVAIVALDDQQRVAMIRQYRHPVGQDCWEIPAGLVDVEGESLLATAQRELAEEADMVADTWSVLVDHYPSAGSSTEAIRIFLAQDIRTVPEAQRHQRVGEEAHLTLEWVALDEALHAVMSGAVKNVNAITGIMAAHLVATTQRQPRSTDSPF